MQVGTICTLGKTNGNGESSDQSAEAVTGARTNGSTLRKFFSAFTRHLLFSDAGVYECSKIAKTPQAYLRKVPSIIEVQVQVPPCFAKNMQNSLSNVGSPIFC